MNMNTGKTWNHSVAGLAAAVIALACLSCTKEGPPVTVVTFTVGTTHLVRENEPPRRLCTGETLNKGDRIITGENSEVAIQAGGTILIKVLPNSAVALSSLLESGRCSLFQERGKILSKSKKLMKGESYLVHNRTAIAAVRGTEFMVTFERGVSSVAVAEGRVEVTKIETGERRFIGEGGKAVISDAFDRVPLQKVDFLYIKKVSIVPFVDDLKDIDVESAKEIEKGFRPEEKRIDAEIEKLLSVSLIEMLKMYGKIDVVKLYSGKTIRGIITERGEEIVILTPGGTVSVPRVKVQKTMVVTALRGGDHR